MFHRVQRLLLGTGIVLVLAAAAALLEILLSRRDRLAQCFVVTLAANGALYFVSAIAGIAEDADVIPIESDAGRA